MAHEFEKVLDECVDRLNRGESLAKCLADFPEYAEQLEPLLKTMVQTQTAFTFNPSIDAKRAGRQHLYAALEKEKHLSFWQNLLSRRSALVTTVSVLVVIIAAYFGLRTTLFQENPGWEYVSEPVPGTSPQPTPQYIAAADIGGNFTFLVSDEVNAIADFTSLKVTVDRVGILGNGSDSWLEFNPEIKEFDLTLLPGEKTQELWRGNLPEGQYNKVFIYITQVKGVLKASGETIDVKLPSHKLQMTLPFQVSKNKVTSFVYDLTVVHAGNAKNGGKYLLKPQIGESGASQEPLPKSGPEKDKKAAIPPDTLAPLLVTNTRRQ